MEGIILIGAPGSGKGTTAEALKESTAFEHVSTGDMLRDALKKGSEVGQKAKAYMERGELVPDGVIISLVEDKLDQKDGKGLYMFDGFPRTVVQAELLDKSMASRGGRISHVFNLAAPREVLISRLEGRRICRKCGRNFHVVNIPPKKEGECDACGGELYQRADDRRATIENRLEVFERQTESLISLYEKQGVLVNVDSSREIGQIRDDIVRVLKSQSREQ
jgi:adenylate kinase